MKAHHIDKMIMSWKKFLSQLVITTLPVLIYTQVKELIISWEKSKCEMLQLHQPQQMNATGEYKLIIYHHLLLIGINY